MAAIGFIEVHNYSTNAPRLINPKFIKKITLSPNGGVYIEMSAQKKDTPFEAGETLERVKELINESYKSYEDLHRD